MKLRFLLPLFLALAVFALPAAADDEVLLSFTGYDYETNGSPNAIYLQVGDSYYGVGFATSFHPLWLAPYVDNSANEYTFYQHTLVVDSYFFGGNVLSVTFAPGGVVDYYEDASKDARNPPNPPNCAKYGTSPPNADSPAKFSNGLLAISGSLANAGLYYDYNANQGGFQSEMNITGGAYAFYVPAGSWNGWFMSGLVNVPPGGGPCPAPTGYDHQLSGECRHPVVPTSHGTWGSLKKLYR